MWPASSSQLVRHATACAWRSSRKRWAAADRVAAYDLDTEVDGLVGLRVRVHRRGVELYLVDHPDARVFLTGLARPQIAAGFAFTAALYQDEPHRLVGRAFPGRLSPAEQRHLESYSRIHAPAHLASGLLRRIHVLGDALWINTWTNGYETLQVEWPGGVPTRLAVTTKLTCPITGLPGGRTIIDSVNREPVRLRQPAGPTGPGHTGGGPSELVFRSHPAPTPDGDRRLQARLRSTHPGWAAWLSLTTPQATSRCRGAESSVQGR